MLVRKATRADARTIAGLMGQLGYDADPKLIERKLEIFAGSINDAVFLATCGDDGQHVAGYQSTS